MKFIETVFGQLKRSMPSNGITNFNAMAMDYQYLVDNDHFSFLMYQKNGVGRDEASYYITYVAYMSLSLGLNLLILTMNKDLAILV